VDDLQGRQELYNGFGDTFTRGMEMVLTPILLAGMGYLLDWIFGLVPVLTVVFAIVGVIGVAMKEYYTYAAAMQAHEDNAPWAKRKATP
jgi:F0F1-type ATP synthase assembly protein I